MPTPVAHTYYEKLDLEIGRRLPLTKHLENSLLGILVLRWRTLRAFVPADHVFHIVSSVANGMTDYDRMSLLLAIRVGETGQTGNSSRRVVRLRLAEHR